MSNYNKVKTEGVEEFEKLIGLGGECVDHEGDLRIDYQEKFNSFLSTFAENIKNAVEEDRKAIEEHETRKLLDGFAHNSNECEICKTLTK